MNSATLEELERLTSPARLAPYLREADDDLELALELHNWNVSISAACMEVVALIEIMLRNVVDESLSQFAREKDRAIPWFMLPTVTGASQAQITADIEKVRGRLRGINPNRETRDQIVAGLSFGFWTELFGSKHEQLWRDALNKAVPHTPTGRRKEVSSKLERLRHFRNRLAHHDSLLSQDILFQFEEMLSLAEWISPVARQRIEKIQRVREVYKQRPALPVDTLIVGATQAWPLFVNHGIYVCQPGRNFRPSEYLAFYSDKEIKPVIPKILHRRDHVPWTAQEASRLASLSGDSHRIDRKISKAITASMSEGWTGGRYQIFLLTKNEDPRSIKLPSAIPHLRKGRGSAFVQGHRYASHHSLQAAEDTSHVR